MDYKKDLEINMNNLDKEWKKQPILFIQYAEKMTEAQKQHSLDKEKLDLIAAELDNKIRANPEEFALKKVTEASVKQAVIFTEEYQGQSKVVIESRYEYELLRSAVTAFEQRKTALENLVKLHGQSYFSTPKEDISTIKTRSNNVSDRIKNRINRNKED